jgi:hypothetical protein
VDDAEAVVNAFEGIAAGVRGAFWALIALEARKAQ